MRVKCHYAFDFGSVFGDYQIGHVPFLGEFHAFGHALLPQGEEDLMADAVGRVGGATNRFLAEILGMSAKTSLCDMAVLSTGERHTVMFQIDYGFRRLFGEQFGRVLVDEPIAAFDRVEVVPVPVVFFDVAEAGRNAAFRGTGVRAQRLEFGDHQDVRLDAGFLQGLHLFASQHSQCCGQACRACADDYCIIHIFNMLRTHSNDFRTRCDLIAVCRLAGLPLHAWLCVSDAYVFDGFR